MPTTITHEKDWKITKFVFKTQIKRSKSRPFKENNNRRVAHRQNINNLSPMILSDSLLINKSLLINLFLLPHSFLYQFSQFFPNATTLLLTILYRLFMLFLFELPLSQPIHSFAMLPYLLNLFLVMRKNGLSFDQPFRGLSPNSNPVAKHQLARPVPLHQVPIGVNVPHSLHIAPSKKTNR